MPQATAMGSKRQAAGLNVIAPSLMGAATTNLCCLGVPNAKRFMSLILAIQGPHAANKREKTKNGSKNGKTGQPYD